MSTKSLMNVPHLATSLQGPLQEIEKNLLDNQPAIETWLREQARANTPLIYSSVDIRNAGFKIAPVDTNLFPAGFNNLNLDFISLCIQAIQSTMEETCSKVMRIMLIPEDHTRNIHYLENVAILQQIFTKAGYETRIGSLLPDLQESKTIELPSGKHIVLEPIVRDGNRLGLNDFNPDAILLNNDLSSGVPDILKDIEQLIMPGLHAGWATRLKSTHFGHYQNVTQEFGDRFGIDPWLIAPLFHYCGRINFMAKDGEHCLAAKTDTLLQEVRVKYREYGITNKPFAVVKADAGTYGMAVMMVEDAMDLKNLNRKERTRMASIKGGREVNQVIIQEGVPTIETWGKKQTTAEPVVYMIGRFVVGGFYRTHGKKSATENLNTPGMNFEPLAFAKSSCEADKQLGCEQNRFYAYSVIARLAAIAAARES